MSLTFIVTGAAGFIGRHTCRRLALRGARVVGIGHGRFDVAAQREWGVAEWIDGDTGVALAKYVGARPQAVLHCAGSGNVKLSFEQPAEDFRKNVQSLLEVLEWVRLSGDDIPVVTISSAAVYGNAHSVPIGEDEPLRPISPYGFHKLTAETLCREYGESYAIRSLSVRLFSVYGKGLRKQLLWDACNKLIKGNASFMGTGEEERDFICVEDAASLLIAGIEHAAVTAPVINGGCGVSVRVRDVLTALACEVAPDSLISFNGAVRAGDPQVYRADISRALAWGWRPQIDWVEGVREYARWFVGGAL